MDWEILTVPTRAASTATPHLAVKAAVYPDGRTAVKVLNGDLLKDYTGQYGINYGRVL